jgi:hydrogenase maturation factor
MRIVSPQQCLVLAQSGAKKKKSFTALGISTKMTNGSMALARDDMGMAIFNKKKQKRV